MNLPSRGASVSGCGDAVSTLADGAGRAVGATVAGSAAVELIAEGARADAAADAGRPVGTAEMGGVEGDAGRRACGALTGSTLANAAACADVITIAAME